MTERWMEGHCLGFDLETDSPDPSECLPVSFALVNFIQGKVSRQRHGLIRSGRPIPAEATAIHGITNDDVNARGGTLENSLHGILGALLFAAHHHEPVIGMNVSFDLTVIDCCLRRLEGEGLWETGWDGDVIDVLVLDRHCDKYRRGGRKLVDLCKHYGVELPNAHSAVDDAVAATHVAFAMARKYPEVANTPIHELHIKQRVWRQEWVKSFSAYRVSKGEPPLDEKEEHWPLRPAPEGNQ